MTTRRLVPLHAFALAALASSAVSGALPARAAPVAGFELVTPDEAREAHDAEAAPRASSQRSWFANGPASPTIHVVTPDASAAVHAPLHLEIAFGAQPGTRIVPATFRVYYGVLKVDLTERLKGHARVTETGVVVDAAAVPEGQHRLFLQIGNDRGDVGEAELRITVAD